MPFIHYPIHAPVRALQQTRQIASATTADDPTYWLQLRPKVTILSNDGSIVWHIYDSFAVDIGSFSSTSFSSKSFSFGKETNVAKGGSFTPASFMDNSFNTLSPGQAFDKPSFTSNPNKIRIIRVTVTIALNSTGTFEVWVEDSDGLIDRNNIGLGCRFNIAIGKSADQYQDVIHGYCKTVHTKRDDTGTLIYVFGGYGSQVIFSERVVEFQKLAPRDTIGSSFPGADLGSQAYQLVRTLLNGTDPLPIKGLPTIQQQGGFTENGIDPRVNNQIPAISQPLVEASQVMNTIANYSGAIWGVQNDDVFFRFPTMIHTGITIKDRPSPQDPINKTSYYIGPWDFIDSIDQQDGFANRIWLKGGTLSASADVASTSNNGFTPLFNKDIAQQIIPGSPRLKNLALLLSKIGTGGAANQPYLEGTVVLDNGGLPTGATVLDLQVPVSSIGVTPTAVFDFGAKFSVKDILPNQPYWIILYAKGTDENDTIFWHHDGDFTTPNRFSASRSITLDATTEDRITHPLKNDPTGWNVSNTGPVYSHAFFKGVKALAEASDPQSQAKYGIIEAVHNVPWISDNQTLQNYATSILASIAKPIRKFTLQQVTIPDGFVFLPGMQVSIVDSMARLGPPQSLDAEIQEVRYDMAAPSSTTARNTSAPSNSPGIGGGTHGLGTNYAEIMPIAYLDFLTSSL